MTDQQTKRVALNPPAAAAALARTDRQRPNALIPPTEPAPTPQQEAAPPKPTPSASPTRATRQTTSTRISTDVDRQLRKLAKGKRWGRWIEAELKATETHLGDNLHQTITDMIREEDEAIELRPRTALSIRITDTYRQHLDQLAEDLHSQTAVVLRCLLEKAAARLLSVSEGSR